MSFINCVYRWLILAYCQNIHRQCGDSKNTPPEMRFLQLSFEFFSLFRQRFRFNLEVWGILFCFAWSFTPLYLMCPFDCNVHCFLIWVSLISELFESCQNFVGGGCKRLLDPQKDYKHPLQEPQKIIFFIHLIILL